jgi:outer membrane protein insertion porin family
VGSGGSLALLFLWLCLAARSGAAGTGSLPTDADALPVTAIEVRGNHAAETQLVLRTLDVPLGEPLSGERLRAGQKALWGLGLFSNVEIKSEPSEGGQRLIVEVTENPRITSLDFTGNKKIGTEDLKGKVSLRPGQLLSRKKLEEGCRAVEKAYQEEGYAGARCIPDVQESQPGEARINFRVEEGPRVKIRGIEIQGNQAFPADALRKELKLKKNSLLHRKRYTADRAREDRGRLEDFYHNHGYKDATVTLGDAEFRDEGRGVVLQFQVEEGPYYLFGNRTWSGNQVVETGVLESVSHFHPGDPFSKEKLEQTTADAYGVYTDKGYLLEISITPETSSRGDTIDVAYTVVEGRPSNVHEISIVGNRRTKERVIRREMTLYPGDLLRRSALMRSQRDIFALGFFEDVQLDYQPTGEGTDVDLVFRVKEKSTGQASGGVGYSSETGLTGFVQLGHPNLFGNGQSVSISLERGGRRENYDISFQDPWVFGYPTSVGLDVFNTRSTRDLYTETRKGGAVTVGRPWLFRFPDFAHVYLGLSMEDFRYSQFDPSLLTSTAADGVPLAERLSASSGRIHSTFLSFVRNSTDNPFYPTLGARTTARFELAGGPFQGDQHYFKPTIDHRVYFQPVWKPSLMMRWRLGWLMPLGGNKGTPSTETFRLGGTRPFEYLRGYDDYYIVPDENVQGVGSGQVRFPGGRVMMGFTTELQFPIVNPVRGLLFYDAGNTWNKPGELAFTGLKEGLGAGLRFEIPMLGQIGLDYAYGTALKHWRFHFILGPAF